MTCAYVIIIFLHVNICSCTNSRVGIAQSVQRLATGLDVRIPVGGEISRTRSDWSWGPPTFLHNGYRVSFLSVTGCCKHGNEPSVSMKWRGVGGFLD